MTRDTNLDLDRLAQGVSIDRAAFFALLADPTARQDLRQLALVRAALAAARGELVLAAGEKMDVTWEEIASHAERTLTDEARKRAVERFLNEHFPEALQRLTGKAEAGTVPLQEMHETVAEAPEKQPAEGEDGTP